MGSVLVSTAMVPVLMKDITLEAVAFGLLECFKDRFEINGYPATDAEVISFLKNLAAYQEAYDHSSETHEA